MDFVMSYSGGKDSTLALYKMIQSGHRPVALLTTVNTESSMSWFHGIRAEILEKVSDSLQIPMLLSESKPDEYESAISQKLQIAKEMGATAVAFGDIDIEGHYVWNKSLCDKVGLECFLPLWQKDRESLTREFVNSGFKAVIKIIQCEYLDESFLGKTLTIELINQLKVLGIDVCGENGEYHSFVYDGPLFNYPLNINLGEIIDLGTHKAIDISLH